MRKPDWPARLVAFIESRRDRPYSYDGNDCVMFCAAAIEAMTGANPLRFSYGSKKEALRLMQEHGGLASMVDDLYPRVPVSQLKRGDLALVEDDGQQGLCVVYPPHLWTPGLNAVLQLPLSAAATGWRTDGR